MTTTDTGSQLLSAIIADPQDDTARLAYADYLDENDDGDHAAFIRHGVKMGLHTDCPVRLADLARGRPLPLRCGQCDYCLARRACEGLANGVVYRLAPDVKPGWSYMLDPGPMDWSGYHDFGQEPLPGMQVVLSRGFIATVICRADVWVEYGNAIVAANPVERVHLTTAPDWNEGWGRNGPEGAVFWIEQDTDETGDPYLFTVAELTAAGELMNAESVSMALLRLRWPRVAFTLPTA